MCIRDSPRGDYYEIVKIHWWNLKIFFSRTIEPFSTKLDAKHPWTKGIQVCSNEGPHPFPRGDYCEIAKIHRRNSKIFFSRTTEPISTKLGTKHPWVKMILVLFFQMNDHALLKSGDNCKIVKLHHWKLCKVFFSRTTWTFSTKLGTKASDTIILVKVQSLLKWEIITNSRNALTNLKIFFSRTSGKV